MADTDSASEGADLNAVYISYRESRQNGKAGRTLKYYLQDTDGEETLCAVGEETTQGDAHYFYRNAKSFRKYGVLACHNRRDLHLWLDAIIAGSAKQGSPSEDGVAGSGGGADKKRMWVSHRQEKFHFDDGRRGTRFYLVDDEGVEVAAVLGEERDTRDGHYMYRKDEHFNWGHPLCCGNLTGVHRWLREMMIPGAVSTPPPPSPSAGRPPKRASATRVAYLDDDMDEDDEIFLLDPIDDPSAVRQSKRQRGADPDDIWGTRTGAFNLADDDKWLLEQVIHSASERRAALAWLREPPLDDICEEVRRRKDIVDECCAAGEGAGQQVLHETLAALRDLECYHMSLSLLEATGVSRSVAALRAHAYAPLASLAGVLCDQWQGMLYRHMGTLTLDLDEAMGMHVEAQGPGGGLPAGAGGRQRTRDREGSDGDNFSREGSVPRGGGGFQSPKARRGGGALPVAGSAAASPSVERRSERERRPPARPAGGARPSPRVSKGAHLTSLDIPGSPAARSRRASSTSIAHVDREGGTTPKCPSPKSPQVRRAGVAVTSPGGKLCLGKGRKLCTECDQVVGSPTRVCPHCQATLPLKITPKSPGPKSPKARPGQATPQGTPKATKRAASSTPKASPLTRPGSWWSTGGGKAARLVEGATGRGGRGERAAAAAAARAEWATARSPGTQPSRGKGSRPLGEGLSDESGSAGTRHVSGGSRSESAGSVDDREDEAFTFSRREVGGDVEVMRSDDEEEEEEEEEEEGEEGGGGEKQGVFEVEGEGEEGDGLSLDLSLGDGGGAMFPLPAGGGGEGEVAGGAPGDDEELAAWLAPVLRGAEGSDLAGFLEGQRARLASCQHAELRTVVKSCVQGACTRLRAVGRACGAGAPSGGAGGGDAAAALRHVDARCRALLGKLEEAASATLSAERARVRRDIIRDFDSILDAVSPEVN